MQTPMLKYTQVVIADMKRKDFYKLYYAVTDKVYADHILWTEEDSEQAWRKGQIRTSKLGRKIFIFWQYAALLAAVIGLAAGAYAIGITLGALFLLGCVLTNYSVIKIELLYAVYRRNDVFSSLLYMVFRGGLDAFGAEVKLRAGKRIGGFVPEWKAGLWAKYSVVYRKQGAQATIWLYPNKMVVKTGKGKCAIADRALSMQALAEQVAQILTADT